MFSLGCEVPPAPKGEGRPGMTRLYYCQGAGVPHLSLGEAGVQIQPLGRRTLSMT
jgi:hypothetical protein